MHDASSSASSSDQSPAQQPSLLRGWKNPRLRRWGTRIGVVLSVLLMIGAIVFVSQRWDMVADALDGLRNPEPLAVAGLLGTIVANVILTGLLFSLLVSRYGRVGLLEMQALVAATTLLNFLPMRPGLLGRVAYHKLVNEIAIQHSVKVLVQAFSMTFASALSVAGCIVLSQSTGVQPGYYVAGELGLVLIVLLIPATRFWAAAFVIRLIDVLAWTARYLLVFLLLDHRIGFNAALALACISMFATMVPFFSNGLGLREWGIGLATPYLTLKLSSALGLTAELVNRAAELLVIVVCGVIGSIWIAARQRAASQRAGSDQSNSDHAPQSR